MRAGFLFRRDPQLESLYNVPEKLTFCAIAVDLFFQRLVHFTSVGDPVGASK
jgi:hypothetical protein